MTIHLHRMDLPEALDLGATVAIDTETTGLNLHRDRLCLVQLSSGDGDAHLVHFPRPDYAAPNLRRVLADESTTKLFHYARFDLAVLITAFDIACRPVYCTKIASKLVRTYAERHSLKDLCSELLGVELSKQQQGSDWGAAELSQAQQAYAAADVLHLHALRARLDSLLEREGRRALADACFRFLPTRAELDLAGWAGEDVFAH